MSRRAYATSRRRSGKLGILFAVVGGIIGLVVVLTPYVLRFVGIVLIVVFAIWGLGKLVTCAQRGAKNDQ